MSRVAPIVSPIGGGGVAAPTMNNVAYIRTHNCIDDVVSPAVGATAEAAPLSRAQRAEEFRGGRLRPYDGQPRVGARHLE
eukprot:8794912-Pyramimonas_sp.AAC.1